MTVFRAATLRTFFFAIFAGAKKLKPARRSVLHCESIPMSAFTSLPQLHDSNSEEPHALGCSETSEGSCSECEESSSSPKQFTQQELNDLIGDLNLSKQRSKLSASRLKEKKLPATRC